MKKQQKTLSPLQLEARKIANKYVDYKKVKREDFHNEISQALKNIVEEVLMAELSHHLGYEKGNRSKKGVHRPNNRNGFSSKTVNCRNDNIRLKIPRDRNGTFVNKFIGKYETNLSDIEEQVFSLFASGMSYEDIANTIKNIYKKEVSNAWISSITDKLLPEIEKWKSQKIDDSYPILYIDGMFFNVKENGVFVKKSLYLILAIDWQGNKKILDFGLKIPNQQVIDLMFFSELKTRGLQDVLIISCDNLSGISQAIEAVFRKQIFKNVLFTKLETRFQKFLTSTKRVCPGYEKVFIKRLIKNLQCKILMNLQKMRSKISFNYQVLVCKLRWTNDIFLNIHMNWGKIIYTTNSIESVNRLIRKNTKTKGGIQSVNYLSKITYLTLQNASIKWKRQVRNWDTIKKQLEIIFPNRLNNVKLN
ncbi:transposase [Mesomycoplasma ovipneumoniae]|nr:transposase [Mesomycoplasma ovipneumoniae]WNM15188.1 transposase [Mesomycoplasma ovipneumoniae]